MRALETIRPGLFTTVQDLGRFGGSRWGVPVSGSADPFSAAAANWLAGNAEDAAVLEITLGGAEFEALVDLRAGVAGAPAPVSVGGRPVEPGRTVAIARGERIAIGPAAEGLRVYLAVAGGFDVPPALGSRSTLVGAQIGGYGGRRLTTGDVLESAGGGAVSRALPDGFLSDAFRGEARAIVGPQLDRFGDDARRTLFEGAFRVSPRSDRRGIRLEGPAVVPAAGEIEPEGVVVGAVQVPPGGEPIVLMPDGPVTGGYPKIATVVRADLAVLGQWRPGQTVRFREVSRDEAIAAGRGREEAWRRLRESESARST